MISGTGSGGARGSLGPTDQRSGRTRGGLPATGGMRRARSGGGWTQRGGGQNGRAANGRSAAATHRAGPASRWTGWSRCGWAASSIAFTPRVGLAGAATAPSVGSFHPAYAPILRVRRTEFTWAVAALLGVMLLGTLRGILVAIIFSLVALAQQTANPPVSVLGRKPGTNVFRPRSPEHMDDESFPGLLLLRLEGRVFFLNAERIAEKLRPLIAEARPKVVVLDLSGVFDLEYSALKMLAEGEKRQRLAGVMVWLTGLSPEVYAMVQRSPLGEVLGPERLFFNLEMAVDRYRATVAADSSQD